MVHDRAGVVFLCVTASVASVVALWRYVIHCDNQTDDELAQTLRLVSPRRCKDDDERLIVKRRRTHRPRSPRMDDYYVACGEAILKRKGSL